MSEDLFVDEKIDVNDDPVVSEVPVFLNVAQQPFVFQYPTRKLTERAREQNGQRLRLKHTTGQVELDIESDMPNMPKTSEAAAQTFGGMLKPSKRYAVGKLESDGLYLSMVQKTSQLRPQFTHTSPEEKAATTASSDKPVNIRAVQMSAKSVENIQRYSEVIDYYNNVQKEEAQEYSMENGTWDLLKTQ